MTEPTWTLDELIERAELWHSEAGHQALAWLRKLKTELDAQFALTQEEQDRGSDISQEWAEKYDAAIKERDETKKQYYQEFEWKQQAFTERNVARRRVEVLTEERDAAIKRAEEAEKRASAEPPKCETCGGTGFVTGSCGALDCPDCSGVEGT